MARTSKFDNTKLRDNSAKHPLALGCTVCDRRSLCGGLHVEEKIFDCSYLCLCDSATEREKCARACPLNVSVLVARENEVGGFALDTPASEFTPIERFAHYAPIVKDATSRRGPLPSRYVALGLDKLVHGDWKSRTESRAAMSAHFGIRDDAHFIISGVAKDGPLERFWGSLNRTEIICRLAELQPSLITTPNFSLFSNVPRHDNLHSMKRIALIWHELADAGLPTALHLNARTDRDWERWREFLAVHPEIRAISFEFLTGPAGSRHEWYRDQLKRVADEALQPLTLILRGGFASFQALSKSFAHVTLLSMNPFIKTVKRRRLRIVGQHLKDSKAPTNVGVMLDKLLLANVMTEQSYVEHRYGVPIMEDSLQHAG